MKSFYLFMLTLLICNNVYAQPVSEHTESELTFSDPSNFWVGATYSLNRISLINGDWMNCTATQLGFYNDTVEDATFDLSGIDIHNYTGQASLKSNRLNFNPGIASPDYFVTQLSRGEGPQLGMGGLVDFDTTGFQTQGTGTILESGYDPSGNFESSGYYADGDINIMWSPADAVNGAVGKILSLWEEDSASEKWYVDGNGNISSSSDSRWKEQVKLIGNPLEKINQINGVSYQWKQNEAEKSKGTPAYRSLGVIAQELEKVLPEAVQTNGQGHKFVSYDQLIPVLIEAVKELDVKQKQNNELEAAVNMLKSENILLYKRLEAIEKLLKL